MKKCLMFSLLFITLGASALRAQTTATPVITLATGTYLMPQNTTITDSTGGATIKWCYTGTGNCTPGTTYTAGASIYVSPTTTETICANATASGYSQSSTACNYYVRATTATPVLSLATGTYQMPQNTTISDSTSGSTILWCYVTTGTCAPSTTYTSGQHIYVDPTSTETICANASATGYQQGGTVCNYYTAGSGAVTFSYAGGNVTMSTSIPNAWIFYTLDGSIATEASIKYTVAVPVASGTVINAVAVTMTSGSNTGVAVQNGQENASNWKTNLACYADECSTYLSKYTNPPPLNYAKGTKGCSPYSSTCVNNTTSSGWNGVQGIPTQLGMNTNESLPTALGTNAYTASFTLSTEGYPNSSINGSTGGTAGYHGTQVLWPYNTGGGCDSCTSMVEDFYIWPEYTSTVDAGYGQNWELDMNSWKTSGSVYLGASMQCSNNSGGWEYNGQHANYTDTSGWKLFNQNGFSSTSSPITQDCQLPFGTLSAAITSATQTSFTVTPNQTTVNSKNIVAAGVEPGMILLVDNEEIMCGSGSSGNTCASARRGWAGTSPTTHAQGAYYEGSVHVQYHVTFKPGDTSVCNIDGKTGGGQAVECIFVDYLILNNHEYNFHTLYGEQTVSGVGGYSALSVPAYTLDSGYPDRVFDQKQIDIDKTVGSSSNQVEVGAYIDQDNVTASFGVAGSSSYTVP